MTRRAFAGLGVLAAGVVLFGAGSVEVVPVSARPHAPAHAPAVVAMPSERIDPPDNVLVVSDSAIAGIRWVPGAASAVLATDFVGLDLESCRRLVTTSCRGREGRRPPTVLDVVRRLDRTYTTLVVATGYNDDVDTFTRDMAAVVQESVRQGVRRIVWYTLRDDERSEERRDGYARHNRLLRALVLLPAYRMVTVADWNGYTVDRPDWFTDDGIHLRTVGAWGAADYLSRKLAHLDGRPCPMPAVPGGPRLDPCPDPDETGPPDDIAALYPVGQDGVLCYRIGAHGRLVCEIRDEDDP